VTAITRADVRDFIADQLKRWKPATALNRYRSLQASSSAASRKANSSTARWSA
jgi:hypothetical protein